MIINQIMKTSTNSIFSHLMFLSTSPTNSLEQEACTHTWRYSNLHDHNDYKCYLDRRCHKCGLKQHRSYLGGGMWRWEDETGVDKEESNLGMPRLIYLTQDMFNLLRYGLVFSVLIEVFIVLISLDLNQPLRFFSSQAFVFVAVSSVFLFLAWQALNNRFKWIMFIIRERQRTYQGKGRFFMKPSGKRLDMVFILIGYTFSFAFSVMVMIFLAVAHISGTGVTRVVWDHFGEMMFESILFVIAFFFVIYGYFHTLKDAKIELKHEKKKGGIHDQ